MYFQDRQRKDETNNEVFLADILAYQGKFSEAAKLYRKSGNDQLAMNMYSDLRMFDLAQVIKKTVLILIILHPL